jgi:hypothetical protein
MAQTVSHRHPIAEARIRYQINPREIRSGQGGTGAGFSPSTEVFPYWYESTNAA